MPCVAFPKQNQENQKPDLAHPAKIVEPLEDGELLLDDAELIGTADLVDDLRAGQNVRHAVLPPRGRRTAYCGCVVRASPRPPDARRGRDCSTRLSPGRDAGSSKGCGCRF